ncbi:hypothetical protein [Winogradskyella helgolandensis]|uniref:hypothetical protein n=1 Tax=Winogradskyella helgolandensis TaxID=2697010 RepID=UPI0015B85686|nr:hypothetical protein [Winogradskyella helgolandensis]
MSNFLTNRFDLLVRFASRQNEQIKKGIAKQKLYNANSYIKTNHNYSVANG